MTILFFENNHFPKVKLGVGFTSEAHFHHKKGVAFAGDGAFFASGLNEGGAVHFAIAPNTSFANLKDWVAKSFGDTRPTESAYVPGTFYKRMWRPSVCSVNFRSAVSEEKLNESFVALRILLGKLEELFETVEPNSENLSTHGHKIREILLLACMEVESAWSAVLKENEYGSGARLTTRDYVKLSTPMFLDAYEMHLHSYPSFPEFTPFKDWDRNNPTQSLPWYDAYNKTKHDREENLKFATLEHAVEAVGAVVVT